MPRAWGYTAAVTTAIHLLELIHSVANAEPGVRRMPGPHQYAAIRALLERVGTPNPEGLRPGGLIVHTPGSDRPLTMMMAAAALWDSADGNSRIVLVSDYPDLARMMLTRGAMECRQAPTGSKIWEFLRSGARLIACSVDKFDRAINQRFLPFDDPDTFILIDEDRAQSAQRSELVRRHLPRACLIGFSSETLPNAPLFGPVIGEPYTFDQALRDGLTVPLQYERRRAHSESTEASSDEPTTESLDLDRVRANAADVVQHCKSHFSGTEIKGHVLTSSPVEALAYKQALDELGAISSEVVLPFFEFGQIDPNESSQQPLREYVETFHSLTLRKFGSMRRYAHDAAHRFKIGPEPKILIVADERSLTEHPHNGVLYLTRPFDWTELSTVVAHVTGVWPFKQHGLIVDYYGIAPKDREALERYSRNGADLKQSAGHTERGDGPRESRSPVPPPNALQTAYCETLREQLVKSDISVSSETLERLAARIDAVILARRKVDWTYSRDVQNAMKTAIEDEVLDALSGEGIQIDFSVVDEILKDCVETARCSVP
jgi:type I restriction enzyme R subunit